MYADFHTNSRRGVLLPKRLKIPIGRLGRFGPFRNQPVQILEPCRALGKRSILRKLFFQGFILCLQRGVFVLQLLVTLDQVFKLCAGFYVLSFRGLRFDREVSRLESVPKKITRLG